VGHKERSRPFRRGRDGLAAPRGAQASVWLRDSAGTECASGGPGAGVGAHKERTQHDQRELVDRAVERRPAPGAGSPRGKARNAASTGRYLGGRGAVNAERQCGLDGTDSTGPRTPAGSTPGMNAKRDAGGNVAVALGNWGYRLSRSAPRNGSLLDAAQRRVREMPSFSVYSVVDAPMSFQKRRFTSPTSE
jgi:hypothetical protein